MEHAEVGKLNMVERYLLNELTPTERDAFEEHFFTCEECARDVRVAATFISNAREIMRRTQDGKMSLREKPERRRTWHRWLQPGYAVAMVIGIALAIGYQSVLTFPRIKRDSGSAVVQALPTLSLTNLGSRGETGNPEITVPPNSAFGIYLDVPAEERFTSYSSVVKDSNGKDQFKVDLTAAQTRNTVELLIPPGILRSGSYQVVIFGHSAGEGIRESEIARYPFVVKNSQ